MISLIFAQAISSSSQIYTTFKVIRKWPYHFWVAVCNCHFWWVLSFQVLVYHGVRDFILDVSYYAVRLHLVWVLPGSVTGSQEGPLVQNQSLLHVHPRISVVYLSDKFGRQGQLDQSFYIFFFSFLILVCSSPCPQPSFPRWLNSFEAQKSQILPHQERDFQGKDVLWLGHSGHIMLWVGWIKPAFADLTMWQRA